MHLYRHSLSNILTKVQLEAISLLQWLPVAYSFFDKIIEDWDVNTDIFEIYQNTKTIKELLSLYFSSIPLKKYIYLTTFALKQ